MDKITIGIEKRLTMPLIEQALRSTIEGTATADYFRELASTCNTGANRAKKGVVMLNRLTVKSRLMEYIMDNTQAIDSMLRSNKDRSLLFVAMMCASYTMFYDTVTLLGKYFHVQETVSRNFLIKKLSEKYGSNRALYVAFDCVMPMLIEAGFVERAEKGVYSMVKQEKYSDAARRIYEQSFLLNNPTIKEGDDFYSHPYFEFIRQ